MLFFLFYWVFKGTSGIISEFCWFIIAKNTHQNFLWEVHLFLKTFNQFSANFCLKCIMVRFQWVKSSCFSFLQFLQWEQKEKRMVDKPVLVLSCLHLCFVFGITFSLVKELWIYLFSCSQKTPIETSSERCIFVIYFLSVFLYKLFWGWYSSILEHDKFCGFFWF